MPVKQSLLPEIGNCFVFRLSWIPNPPGGSKFFATIAVGLKIVIYYSVEAYNLISPILMVLIKLFGFFFFKVDLYHLIKFCFFLSWFIFLSWLYNCIEIERIRIYVRVTEKINSFSTHEFRINIKMSSGKLDLAFYWTIKVKIYFLYINIWDGIRDQIKAVQSGKSPLIILYYIYQFLFPSAFFLFRSLLRLIPRPHSYHSGKI